LNRLRTGCILPRKRDSVWLVVTQIKTTASDRRLTMTWLDQVIGGFLFTLGAVLLFLFGSAVGFFDF
jgi:hypothetical protein